jgi:hypothetical protein
MGSNPLICTQDFGFPLALGPHSSTSEPRHWINDPHIRELTKAWQGVEAVHETRE